MDDIVRTKVESSEVPELWRTLTGMFWVVKKTDDLVCFISENNLRHWDELRGYGLPGGWLSFGRADRGDQDWRLFESLKPGDVFALRYKDGELTMNVQHTDPKESPLAEVIAKVERPASGAPYPYTMRQVTAAWFGGLSDNAIHIRGTDSKGCYLAVTIRENDKGEERVYVLDICDPDQKMTDITDWTTVEFARYVDEWRAWLVAQDEKEAAE